jgi:hypothetical protein
MFVAEVNLLSFSIENDNRFRSMLDEGTKARFTGGEGSGAFGHPALKGLV